MEISKELNILVTGLTFWGNKGGEALALSLINEINYFTKKNNHFIFAVPENTIKINLKIIKNYSDNYSINIIETPTLFIQLYDIFPMLRFFLIIKKKICKREIKEEDRNKSKIYKQAIKEADLIIDESGVSFVGDGTRDIRSSIFVSLIGLYSKKYNKKFFRYTQSYGPFNKGFKNYFIKKIASINLKNLKLIYVRGEKSKKSLQKIIKNTSIISYPDIAIKLKPVFSSYQKLKKREKGFDNFVCIIPNSVIYNLNLGNSTGDNYIELIKEIIVYFKNKGYNIVLLPHAIYKNFAPKECDLFLCKKIYDSLDNNGVIVIDQNNNCEELKGIIYNAKYVISSRYHGLVASLSSGVKSFVIGWNDKYEDLAKFYVPFDITIDARKLNTEKAILKIKEILNNYENYKNNFAKKQDENELLVEESIKKMFEFLFNENKQEKLYNVDIIKKRKTCIGCNSCKIICPKNIIKYKLGPNEEILPIVDISKCIKCGLCLSVCPSIENNYYKGFKSLHRAEKESTKADWLVGFHKNIYTAFSNNKNDYDNASSGGTVRTLVKFLFDSKKIDCVIYAKKDIKNRHYFSYSKAENINDFEPSSSIYSYVDTKNLFKYINDSVKEKKRTLIITLPCILMAISNYLNYLKKIGKYDFDFVFFSVFCDGCSTTKGIKTFCKAKKINNIKDINFRPVEKSGSLKINNSIFIRTGNLSDFCFWGRYLPNRCFSCKDMTGELADISFGDAWINKYAANNHKANIIISRTVWGDLVLKEAEREGIVTLNISNVKEIVEAQKYSLLNKKINNFNFIENSSFSIFTRDIENIDYIGIGKINILNKRFNIKKVEYNSFIFNYFEYREKIINILIKFYSLFS